MNNTETINNITQYDLYYEGGKESLYNKRFKKNKITAREAYLISNNLKSAIKNHLKANYSHEFRILDYGCGDGRIFSVIEKTISMFSGSKIKFIVDCYDVSIIGLREFSKESMENGYIPVVSNNKQHHIVNSLNHNNIRINLIHGNVHDSIDITATKICGNYNLILCMFGVLAHIPGIYNRQNIVSMFDKLLNDNGKLLISVPTNQMFKQEQNIYKRIREDNNIYQMKLAKEDGDLYYNVKDSNINNFYHIFPFGEVENFVENTNLKISNILTYSFFHPKDALKNFIFTYIDKIISHILSFRIFSKSLLYNVSKYVLITAIKR